MLHIFDERKKKLSDKFVENLPLFDGVKLPLNETLYLLLLYIIIIVTKHLINFHNAIIIIGVVVVFHLYLYLLSLSSVHRYALCSIHTRLQDPSSSEERLLLEHMAYFI